MVFVQGPCRALRHPHPMGKRRWRKGLADAEPRPVLKLKCFTFDPQICSANGNRFFLGFTGFHENMTFAPLTQTLTHCEESAAEKEAKGRRLQPLPQHTFSNRCFFWVLFPDERLLHEIAGCNNKANRQLNAAARTQNAER